jgi:hypothetical protein
MAGNNYNIPQLIQKFFGLEGVNLPGVPFTGITGSKVVDGPESQFSGASYLPLPVEVNRSVAGVPIYEQITLVQELSTGNIEYTFPGWPLVEINFSKKIVKTDVTDNPGTVKEFIGQNDREITIRGFLINHDQRAMPLDQIAELNAIAEIGATLKVTSEILNALNVHYLVIENFRLTEVEASIMAQPFIIDAVSDYPYELVIQDAVTSKVLTPQQKARQLLLTN